MSEPLTPEQERAKIVAALPRPLKPIPPEIMAEILAEQVPYDQAEREYRELMEMGGVSIEPYLDELKRKFPDEK
jgi:hypothetical protein